MGRAAIHGGGNPRGRIAFLKPPAAALGQRFFDRREERRRGRRLPSDNRQRLGKSRLTRPPAASPPHTDTGIHTTGSSGPSARSTKPGVRPGSHTPPRAATARISCSEGLWMQPALRAHDPPHDPPTRLSDESVLTGLGRFWTLPRGVQDAEGNLTTLKRRVTLEEWLLSVPARLSGPSAAGHRGRGTDPIVHCVHSVLDPRAPGTFRTHTADLTPASPRAARQQPLISSARNLPRGAGQLVRSGIAVYPLSLRAPPPGFEAILSRGGSGSGLGGLRRKKRTTNPQQADPHSNGRST